MEGIQYRNLLAEAAFEIVIRGHRCSNEPRTGLWTIVVDDTAGIGFLNRRTVHKTRPGIRQKLRNFVTIRTEHYEVRC